MNRQIVMTAKLLAFAWIVYFATVIPSLANPYLAKPGERHTKYVSPLALFRAVLRTFTPL